MRSRLFLGPQYGVFLFFPMTFGPAAPMTAKATVQAADFVKSPRVRPSAALSALGNRGLYLSPAILDTITLCMTDQDDLDYPCADQKARRVMREPAPGRPRVGVLVPPHIPAGHLVGYARATASRRL